MKRLFTLLLISFAALSCEMIDVKLNELLGGNKENEENNENNGVVSDIPNNQIWYTSTDGKIVEPYSGEYNEYAEALKTFGVNIVSNTYVDGKGVIEFDGDVTIIGQCAFLFCSNLTSVTIPDSVTSIGYGAFVYCESLTSVTIPDSVTTIGVFAFEDCDSLTSIIIPDSVTTIGEGAFLNCNRLTSVTIGDSVTTIGERSFFGCSSLQEFNGKFASEDGRCLIIDGTLNAFAIGCGATEYTIPDSVTTIGDYAFAACSSLTSVTIPNSVTTIGALAFEWCESLTSVTISDSVTTIGDEAFWGCSSLTSVTIPDSVTTIGEWAFCSCENLTSVTIGDSVTTIGEGAFQCCSSLTSVYCKAITPPAGDSYIFFGNASGRKFYVPTESVEAYKSASGWSDYADAIVGYNF